MNTSQSSNGHIVAGTINVKDSGAMTIRGETIHIKDGGAGLIQGKTIAIQDGGAAIMIAQQAEVNDSGILFLMSRHVGGQAKILIDLKAAIVLGVAIGLVSGVVRQIWALRSS